MNDKPGLHGWKADVVAGGVTGVIASLSCLSLASLVFTGPLQADYSRGLSLVLLSAVLIRGLLAAVSSLEVSLAGPLAASLAVSAVVAGNLSTQVDPEHLFATVVASLAVSSALTGALLFGLGLAHAGKLTSYVPYPVVGGYLAGLGWLLLRGSFQILGIVPAAQSGSHASLWIPGLGLAAALVLATRRWSRFPVLPTGLLIGFVLFYLALGVSGNTVEAARQSGWLPSLAAAGGVSWASLGSLLPEVLWWPLLGQWASLLTIPVLVAVSVSLTASGLELSLGRSLDLNKELRVTGVANLLLSAVGGMAGAVVPVDTLLAWSLGARSRRVGLVSTLVLLAVLLGGPAVVGLVPTFLQGGFVAFLGLNILQEWIVRGWTRLERGDYVVVVSIVAMIAAVGFLPGVVVGLLFAVLLFVRDSSRVSVIAWELSLVLAHSNVARPRREFQLLQRHGERVQVLRLQGFIFFGSACQVLDAVQARLSSARSLTHVVLDFAHVTALDSSAVVIFRKLRNLAESREFRLIFTGLSSRGQRRLERGEVLGGECVNLALDLDRGLERCEHDVLGEMSDLDPARDILEDIFAEEAGRVRGYLVERELGAGEILFHDGEPPDGLYFLRFGQVSVELEEPPRRLRSFQRGTVLGEVGHYAGTPRSATIEADVPCRLLFLSAAEFARLEREMPEVAARLHRHLVIVLAERLSHRDAQLEGWR